MRHRIFFPDVFSEKRGYAAGRRFPETGAGRTHSGGSASFREAHGRRWRRFRIGTPRRSRTLEGRTGTGRRFFRNARFSSSGWKRWCRFAEGDPPVVSASDARPTGAPVRKGETVGSERPMPSESGGCFVRKACRPGRGAGNSRGADGRALPAFFAVRAERVRFMRNRNRNGEENARQNRARCPGPTSAGLRTASCIRSVEREERLSFRKTVSALPRGRGSGVRRSDILRETAARFVSGCRDYSSGRAGSSVSS